MFRNLKRTLVLSLVLAASVWGLNLIAVGSVLAVGESTQKACEGLTGIGVECDDGKTAEEVAGGPIRSLINILLIVVGAISVIMIIFGGFKFITSGGDTDKTKSGRNTIIYAAVGLALVMLSSFIVGFVFDTADDIGGSSGTTEETTDTAGRESDGRDR